MPAVQPTFEQIIEIFGITSPGGKTIFFISKIEHLNLSFISQNIYQWFIFIFILSI